MAFGRDMLNLEKQFTFYASYHHQPVNVAIHFCCIWPILATAICLLHIFTPPFCATPEWVQSALPYGEYIVINAALVLTLIYVVCYVIMDPLVGSLGAAMVSAIYLYTSAMVIEDVHPFGFPLWKAALTVHIVCWIAQFIGHGFFEGRAPALLDSLDQALLTAPLFVLLEIFFFFGYKRAMHRRMMAQVEKNVKRFKGGKSK